MHWLTPWSRTFLKKLIVCHLTNKHCWNPDRCCPIHKNSLLVQASPCFHHISWGSVLILPLHLRPGIESSLFSSGFSTKTLYANLLFPARATCPAHFFFLDIITEILSEEHNAVFLYAVFSITPLHRLSQAQVSSLPPYSRTPSAYVSPSVWGTKFRTHTKRQ